MRFTMLPFAEDRHTPSMAPADFHSCPTEAALRSCGRNVLFGAPVDMPPERGAPTGHAAPSGVVELRCIPCRRVGRHVAVTHGRRMTVSRGRHVAVAWSSLGRHMHTQAHLPQNLLE